MKIEKHYTIEKEEQIIEYEIGDLFLLKPPFCVDFQVKKLTGIATCLNGERCYFFDGTTKSCKDDKFIKENMLPIIGLTFSEDVV